VAGNHQIGQIVGFSQEKEFGMDFELFVYKFKLICNQ